MELTAKLFVVNFFGIEQRFTLLSCNILSEKNDEKDIHPGYIFTTLTNRNTRPLSFSFNKRKIMTQA
jgi:hypothetical protein